MRINKIQNNNYNTSFGTYMGIHMQEKILLGKTRGVFSQKQLEVLTKIEEDGINAVLEITDKYKIMCIGKKSTIVPVKSLTLGDLYNNIVIQTLDKVYRPTNDNQRLYFNIVQFAKLFDEDFNLAEKIKKSYESFIHHDI